MGRLNDRLLLAARGCSGDDPNGFADEELIVVGGVRLAKRASSNHWKDQVLKYVPLTGDDELSLESLLESIGEPMVVPRALRARCP